MNLYLITQSENNDYDTYDAAVVAAETAYKAKEIHPNQPLYSPEWWLDDYLGVWANYPDQVEAKLLGKTDLPGGVILNSFNAG